MYISLCKFKIQKIIYYKKVKKWLFIHLGKTLYQYRCRYSGPGTGTLNSYTVHVQVQCYRGIDILYRSMYRYRSSFQVHCTGTYRYSSTGTGKQYSYTVQVHCTGTGTGTMCSYRGTGTLYRYTFQVHCVGTLYR